MLKSTAESMTIAARENEDMPSMFKLLDNLSPNYTNVGGRGATLLVVNGIRSYPGRVFRFQILRSAFLMLSLNGSGVCFPE